MTFETFLRERSRANAVTRASYVKEAKRFDGIIGKRVLTPETVHYYEDELRTMYPNVNSRISKIVAVNFYLAYKGSDLRIRTPTKHINPNPRLVKPGETDALLDRMQDPEERVGVRILADSGLPPQEIVTLRVAELDLHGDRVIIRKIRTKTGAEIASVLSPETTEALRALVLARDLTDYIFPATSRATKRPHRERTWLAKVLAKHGAGFEPRAYRRTLATNWESVDKGLQLQGGWKDTKTILAHYRQDDLERHVRAHVRAMARSSVQKPPETPSMERPGPEPTDPSPSLSHKSYPSEVR